MTTLTDPVTKRPLTTRRCRKTRNKTVSRLEPIKLSSLLLSEVELVPGQEHLVCPDCKTWCPITGMCGTPKLVPHHTVRVGNFEPKRCTSSNRLVHLDISLETWRRRRAEGTAETASRRSTRVLRKPKVPAATPVHRIEKQSPKLIAASTHRKTCKACTETTWCAEGQKVAAVAIEAERRNSAVEQSAARRAREQRPQEWATYLPAVRLADLSRLPVTARDVMPIKSSGLPVGTPTAATKIDQKRAESAEKERQEKRSKKS